MGRISAFCMCFAMVRQLFTGFSYSLKGAQFSRGFTESILLSFLAGLIVGLIVSWMPKIWSLVAAPLLSAAMAAIAVVTVVSVHFRGSELPPDFVQRALIYQAAIWSVFGLAAALLREPAQRLGAYGTELMLNRTRV